MKTILMTAVLTMCAQGALAYCEQPERRSTLLEIRGACVGVSSGTVVKFGTGDSWGNGIRYHCYVYDKWVNPQDEMRLAGYVYTDECGAITGAAPHSSRWLNNVERKVLMGSHYYPYGKPFD
jgi:hypothetical protein